MTKTGSEPLEQVASLKVTGLFGRFNHLIEFNPLSDLTIITAPNGYGKTMLIRILDAFFNRRLHFFWKLDFQEIVICFASGKRISISRESRKVIKDDVEEPVEDAEEKLVVTIRSSGFGHDEEFYDVKPSASPRAISYIDRHLPVDRVGAGRWLDVTLGEVLSTNEVLEKYGHLLPEGYAAHTKTPTWLTEAIGAADTHLIETQRLLSLESEEDPRFRNRGRYSKYSSVVDEDAEDLSERIGNILTEYANESQKLDESFPKRIIDVFSDRPTQDTLQIVDGEDQIRARLSELSKKRDRLVEVGLIGETISEPIQPSDIFQQEVLRKFLSIYIVNTENKLRIFDDIYEKIRLFKQIIDEHFSFKRIDFSKQSGIEIRDQDTDTKIPLSELSSGEQHELVLIYELLFKVKDGSLILIDEPELSLHVGWQKRFISDIQKIQRLKHMTFVIATHSPQIINDKWDLVQDLAS
ncbi:AAA family ATPase [Breoghania sp. L-A4]|uniref:AAA family ATPase n=1 Tax=Breoghania sp. L-A4 TaxID=2304600 RepID=UPI000E360360|nr:AAA family ATPase [Breoghania sp. L-A4]AXS39402.1 hypothetical protein D1F64_04260 [Breoghania sp. L-A4]